MICDNCENMEIQIKQSFKQHFKQRTDIGTEYFEGNYKEMMHMIYFIIQQDELTKSQLDTNDEQTDLCTKNMMDMCIYYINAFTTFKNNMLIDKKSKWNIYMKEYYHNNSASISEYRKQNYQKKKDVVNEKIECSCGKIYTKQHQHRHEKTKKHQNWIISSNTLISENI